MQKKILGGYFFTVSRTWQLLRQCFLTIIMMTVTIHKNYHSKYQQLQITKQRTVRGIVLYQFPICGSDYKWFGVVDAKHLHRTKPQEPQTECLNDGIVM